MPLRGTPQHDGSQAAAIDPRGDLRWSRASVVGALLVPILVFAIVAAFLYRNAFVEARERLERAARIGQEHAARVVETNEVVARTVLAQTRDQDSKTLVARQERFHILLRELTAGLGQVQSVWLWDADGAPLASNRFARPPDGLNVADREYFVWAKTHADDAWFVSHPMMSRSTGEPFIDFSRRRSLADGSFGGVLSVSLFPEYFNAFYRQLASREPGLTVALLRSDGAVLARWPKPPSLDTRLGSGSHLLAQMAAGATQGETVGGFAIDQVERLLSFRRVERLPLYVAATFSRADVLAGWYRQVGMLGAFVLPLTVSLAYVAWLALRRAERERAAIDRSRLEAAQRLRAEEALRQAQKLETLGNIAGSVAHDFNNLLMVINNNAHLMRRLVPELQSSPQFAAIGRAIASGTKLTRQLLAFAQRQPLRPTVVSLQEAMPEWVELLRTVVGSGVTVDSAVSPDVPRVEVDRAELELALVNLAVNARDAMPGGGRLEIVARRATAEEAPECAGPLRVALMVSDTGEGIPADIAQRVFEPFFTTKGPGRGTGLGLAQVYGFAAQANGVARLGSVPGVGTTVTLYLPGTDRPAGETEPADAQSLPAVGGHVLLVEDNDEIAASTVPLLRAFGCEVTHATSAEEAIADIARHPGRFDVLLSDIVMPGASNGLSVGRYVRDHHPALPIVLMTGHAAEVHRAVAEGFVVLAKPCGPDVLANALSRAIGCVPRASRPAAPGARNDGPSVPDEGLVDQSLRNAP